MSDTTEHSIGIYLKVWVALFVLSFLSYLVEYYQLEGALRWSLVLFFMVVKAAVIMAVFMHFMLERVSLQIAILGPVILIPALVAIAALDAENINQLRNLFISQ